MNILEQARRVSDMVNQSLNRLYPPASASGQGVATIFCQARGTPPAKVMGYDSEDLGSVLRYKSEAFRQSRPKAQSAPVQGEDTNSQEDFAEVLRRKAQEHKAAQKPKPYTPKRVHPGILL